MNKSFRKDHDWLLIVTTFLLAGFGLVMVYSSSYVWGLDRLDNPYYFIERQLIWFFIASVAFVIVISIPYVIYKKLSPIIIIGSIIALILVKVPGVGMDFNSGADRWINLGFITIQPAEFVKVGIIIYLAQVYSKKQAYIDKFIQGVMPPLAVVAIIFGLIMMQPDLGTATSILIVTLLIVYFSGAKWRHLIGLGIVGISVFSVYAISATYRIERLTSYRNPFVDPWDTGLQLIQSYIAIAHGGLTGAGIGQSVQKLLYLPEPHTDFILAIIAEELGIFGVLFVLGIHCFILFRGVMIGSRCKDMFGSLLAFGIVFQIAIQVIFNAGAVTGILPITGVPLPLVSSGGSSLLITLISIAILANISKHTKRQRRLERGLEQTASAS